MELRIYTLASADALLRYTTRFWPRHIRSLAKYGINVHDVWLNSFTDEQQVIALVGYPSGTDPARLADTYRNSHDFTEDHLNFDVLLITSTQTVTLEPIIQH